MLQKQAEPDRSPGVERKLLPGRGGLRYIFVYCPAPASKKRTLNTGHIGSHIGARMLPDVSSSMVRGQRIPGSCEECRVRSDALCSSLSGSGLEMLSHLGRH